MRLCGLVAPPENSDLVAAALRRLVESSDLRLQLGQNGPARARQMCDPSGRIPDLYQALSGIVSN